MSKNQKPKVKGNVTVKPDRKAKNLAPNSAQLARQQHNRERGIELSPWEKAKEKRLAKRIAAGKTYSNWIKSRTSSKPKPNASNTVTGLEINAGR